MTVPKTLVEQNHLRDGSQVELSGISAPLKRRYKLDDLLAEMPGGKLLMVEGWDGLTPAGLEVIGR